MNPTKYTDTISGYSPPFFLAGTQPVRYKPVSHDDRCALNFAYAEQTSLVTAKELASTASGLPVYTAFTFCLADFALPLGVSLSDVAKVNLYVPCTDGQHQYEMMCRNDSDTSHDDYPNRGKNFFQKELCIPGNAIVQYTIEIELKDGAKLKAKEGFCVPGKLPKVNPDAIPNDVAGYLLKIESYESCPSIGKNPLKIEPAIIEHMAPAAAAAAM